MGFVLIPFLLSSAPIRVNAQAPVLSGNTYPSDPGPLFGSGVTTSGTTTPSTSVISCPKDFSQFTGFIDYATCTITHSIIPLLFAVAMLVFFFGVIKYVISPDGSDNREEGRQFMMYGIVGLFVMVSVWGLVAVISNTFSISTSFPPQFPSTNP